jgi:hypothetical protein
MTMYELDKINAERRRRGLLPLSLSQAREAADSHDGNSDLGHFLISITTGFPMPSVAGIAGAVLHSSPSYSAPEPESSGGGGAFGGAGSSASYESSSSSSSDSSSSGGGSDSGSSSSGGSD